MKVAHEYNQEFDEFHYAFFIDGKKEYYFMFDLMETLIKVGATTEYGFNQEHNNFDIKFPNASKLMSFQDAAFDAFKENVKQMVHIK